MTTSDYAEIAKKSISIYHKYAVEKQLSTSEIQVVAVTAEPPYYELKLQKALPHLEKIYLKIKEESLVLFTPIEMNMKSRILRIHTLNERLQR